MNLSSLGVSSNEQKVFEELVYYGPFTAGEIAKRLHIPRPTSYLHLRNLRDKGLVCEVIKTGTTLFYNEPFEKVSLLISNQKNELDNLEKNLENFKTQAESNNPRSHEPHIKYFEGKEGIGQLLKDLLLFKDTETFAFWPISEMVKVLGYDFFVKHNQERIKRGISVRALWFEKTTLDSKKFPAFGQGQSHLREIRIAPEELESQLGYWCYKDRTIFLSSKKEGFGFIVNSRELVETMKTQFDFMWKQSKKYLDLD